MLSATSAQLIYNKKEKEREKRIIKEARERENVGLVFALELDKDHPRPSVCTHVNYPSIGVPTQILRIHTWTL